MRWLAVAVAAGCLTGCGGEPAGSNTESAAPVADATAAPPVEAAGCDLLTDAEVGAAIGATIAGHEESGLAGCRWTADAGPRLMLDVYTGSSLASSTCEAQKYLGTGREEPVEGLGDSALWKTSGALVVCAPNAVIRFNLDNSRRAVPDDKAALTALARTALERL